MTLIDNYGAPFSYFIAVLVPDAQRKDFFRDHLPYPTMHRAWVALSCDLAVLSLNNQLAEKRANRIIKAIKKGRQMA
ncbi:hypothetical protein JAO76_17820 [Pontibacter sp. BT310]|uniref:Uncharacterized protein n=1 Tax=Pontibacter populi TaxID=890055 RepID=A0ABS6XG00_9BACT|nr:MULTISPECIES: hypothetical protein [Pontibacter]MBJ6120069.1 hypothetical protein [Pontibacter sp. BT310]MBR0572498.1 hypothetical protein [Microvirga sp. STS03]MBW3366922.1 hypothetical protein [Pontibacter populi]